MVQKVIDDLIDKFDGAFAKNTIRAYRQDFTHFANWCQANGVDPFSCPSEAFPRFVAAEAKQYSSATLERRLTSLRSLFKMLNAADPTRSLEGTLAVKRAFRAKGRAQQQAVPLTKDILHKLLLVCGDDIVGQRNRVMLTLGYETMRRRSELCAFKFSDLESLPGGRFALQMRFSKTDQYGQGRLIAISEQLVNLLKQWQAIVGDDGYIIRGVKKGEQITSSLTPTSLNRVLQSLQDKAKLDLPRYLTGHSFRVGAAVDMMQQGASFEQIMLKGGWRSESTVMRYLRAMVI